MSSERLTAAPRICLESCPSLMHKYRSDVGLGKSTVNSPPSHRLRHLGTFPTPLGLGPTQTMLQFEASYFT